MLHSVRDAGRTGNRMIVLCSVLAIIAAQPAFAGAGAAAQSSQQGVNGQNVARADFATGRFEQAEGRTWIEYDRNGREVARFEEVARDGPSVILIDRGRRVSVSLNLARRMILLAVGGEAFADQYPITASYARQVASQRTNVQPSRQNVTTQRRTVPPPPAVSRQQGVTGRNVARVNFAQGYFEQGTGGSWIEYDSAGRPAFRFDEQNRDDWSVFLVDRSRDIRIQIDLHRRIIGFAPAGRPFGDLYPITASFDRAGGSVGGQPGERAVNAGPIWNQADAETKCRRLARDNGAEWTGAWWTTQSGRMSVCQLRFR